MSIGGRVMTTFEAALTAWNTYPNNLVPRRDVPYGEWALRIQRYKTAEGYYHNTIYDQLDAMAIELRLNEKLYKFIRGVFNPVQVFIFLIASYAYKGSIDTQTLKGGATPLIYENTALEDPVKQVIKWSNLDMHLSRYVRDAALLGDAAWWIVDDPQRQRVRMELLDPGRVKYRELDEVGNIKAAVIEWIEQEQPEVARYQPGRFNTELTLKSTDTFLKTIIVDRDSFKTYKDGKPFAFYEDETGRKVVGWDNPYGFVPLKMVYFEEGKDKWGQNAFFGVARRQIDEINDATSLLSDSVRNVVTPILQAYGIRQSDKALTREDKDNVSILYMPNETAKLEPVTIPLDIAAASAHRASLIADLEKNLPVLALQRIREIGGALSGIAIQNMFGDATACIENTRKNLDPGIVSALQMAVTIGGIQGYEGFGAFNADSYDKGDMELSVGDRPVIEDRMTKAEKVDKLVTIAGLPAGSKRQALQEMDYSEGTIAEIVEADEAEKEKSVRDAMRGFSQGVFGDEDEPDADTPDMMDDEDMKPDATAIEKQEAKPPAEKVAA